MSNLKVGAGASTNIDASSALAEALYDATATFGNEIPNLVVCFITDEHRDSADEIATTLGARFPAAAVIGCSARGIIAEESEMEHGPAISVLVAFLPDTRVVPFGLRFEERGDDEPEYVGWPDMMAPDATLLMLCDRFSLPAGHLTSHINGTRPGQILIGGLTSGGEERGDTRLFYSGKVFKEGAVGVAIEGRVRLHSVVSQGCRPVGTPLTITKADRNIIFELAGESPIDVIKKIWQNAPAEDQELMKHGLELGRVVDEYRQDFKAGDFVIRPVLGADPTKGLIAIGDVVQVGETIQFHVRDANIADQDLKAKLGELSFDPCGSLIFSCSGRGVGMFEIPNHDAAQITGETSAPLAGMFCAGEIGPISGLNFLHGFSAAIAFFEDTHAG